MEEKTKLILIESIAQQKFSSSWTDSITKELRLPSSGLERIIKDNEIEKIEYVEKNKFDLIKAIVNGYEVKKEKYVVVSKNFMVDKVAKFKSHHASPWGDVTKIDNIFYQDVKTYHAYFENGGVEDYYSISETEYNDLFNGVLTNELIPTMNQDEAESLLNDYRLKFKVK